MTSATVDQAQATLHRIRSYSDDELVDALSTSFHHFEIQRAHALAMLGEFDARRLSRSRGTPDPAVWLATFAGQSTRAAEDYRTVARRLHRWTAFLEHYLNGAFTYSVVRLALRYVTEDNHDEVLGLALTMNHQQLREALSGRPDQDDKEAREHFSYRIDEDTGWLKGSIRLNPANAAVFLAALKIAELAGLRDLGDLDVPTDATPQELLELLQQEQATENAVPMDEEDGDEDEKPHERHLNRSDLATPLSQERWNSIERREREGSGEAPDQQGTWEDDGGPAPGQPDPPPEARSAQPASRLVSRFGPPTARTRLMALMNLAQMARTAPRSATRAPGAEIHLIIGPDAQPRLFNHLGADASALMSMIFNGTLKYHVQDRNGVTLKTGSPTRVIPASIEDAVLATWGHQCGTPGCCNTRYLQLHHIRGFAEGGPTEVANLMPLCSSCHSLVSDGTTTIHIDEHDEALVHFRFPGGRSFTARRRGLPLRNAPANGDSPYREGPTPHGDEKLLDAWTLDNLSFDDIA